LTPLQNYISFKVSGGLFGVNCFVKRDNESFASYTNNSQMTQEGCYTFYARDIFGNTPEYTITLDRTAPNGTLYAGENSSYSEAMTNASYVTYKVTDNYTISTIQVQPPKSTSYTTMNSGQQWTVDGYYSFFAVDKAGNQSPTVNITLDKTPPIGRLIANNTNVPNGSTTDSDFYYFATDDTIGVSKIELKRPNDSWETYTQNTVIPSTSLNGQYTFRATDKQVTQARV